MLMTCRHVRQLHDSFLDSELSPSLTAEVHAHLLQCPQCQQQVELARAAGDVIARDAGAPMLDSGFAMRVVASLPKKAASQSLETRRDRRQRLWRLAFRAGLPAAAAVLFFCILIWPPTETPSRHTLVAGRAVEVSGVKSVVNPTLDAMAGTRQAAQTIDRLIDLSTGGAREDVKQSLAKAQQAAKVNPSITDILLMPFNGALEPPSDDSDAQKKAEVVRF